MNAHWTITDLIFTSTVNQGENSKPFPVSHSQTSYTSSFRAYARGRGHGDQVQPWISVAKLWRKLEHWRVEFERQLDQRGNPIPHYQTRLNAFLYLLMPEMNLIWSLKQESWRAEWIKNHNNNPKFGFLKCRDLVHSVVMAYPKLSICIYKAIYLRNRK